MYELYDPCTVMFFYRFVVRNITLCLKLNLSDISNKHIMIDLGTGNNNKM
jgi:DIM1 family U5 snRNP protein